MAHAFNPGTQEERQVYFCEFCTSLVYIVLGQLVTHREIPSQQKQTTTKASVYPCDRLPSCACLLGSFWLPHFALLFLFLNHTHGLSIFVNYLHSLPLNFSFPQLLTSYFLNRVLLHSSVCPAPCFSCFTTLIQVCLPCPSQNSDF